MVIIVVDLNKSTINYINKFNQMMKKELFKKFLFLLAFMLSAGIYAQNVTGVVTSDDGPLPGATVLVKGQTVLLLQTLMETLLSKRLREIYL